MAPINHSSARLGVALLAAAPVLALAVLAFQSPGERPVNLSLPAAGELPTRGEMVRLPGGSFRMGSDFGGPDSRPAHAVELRPFWIDRHEVTNRQFAAFVEASGYRTLAERAGSAWVFVESSGEAGGTWRRIDGADWRHPDGPHASVTGKDNWPVVQVTWHDAAAFAAWSSKRLPTEAEWEYAARSGLADADYPWGREARPGGRYWANVRQDGSNIERAFDGFPGAAPVGSYPANNFGVYDLSGNVWEWCSDWYADDYYSASRLRDPTGPGRGSKRVQRGGSWLSADAGGGGPKVWQRGAASPDAPFQHVGFRCAMDDD